MAGPPPPPSSAGPQLQALDRSAGPEQKPLDQNDPRLTSTTKNIRRYTKFSCQKECQKICQRHMPERMS